MDECLCAFAKCDTKVLLGSCFLFFGAKKMNEWNRFTLRFHNIHPSILVLLLCFQHGGARGATSARERVISFRCASGSSCIPFRGGYVDGVEKGGGWRGGEAEKEEKTEKKKRRRRGRDCRKQTCNKGGLQI